MALFNSGIDQIEDVLAIYRQATEVLSSGGLEIIEWNSENTSVKKARTISLQKLRDECISFLRQEAPEIYGQRIKRLTPRYTGL